MRKNPLFGLFIFISLIVSFYGCNYDKPKDTITHNKETIPTPDVFPSDSFAYYENVLAKDSLNTELHKAIATNYYAEKQFEKAIEHLRIVCRIDNKNTEAFITLGNIYYDTEQNEKAIEYYEKALLLDYKNVNVRCDLATCYLNIKNAEKSMLLLKENIKISPDHAQSHHNLSVVYSQMGKTKEAEEEIKVFNQLSK